MLTNQDITYEPNHKATIAIFLSKKVLGGFHMQRGGTGGKIEGELGDSTNRDLLTTSWYDGEKVKRFLGQWPMWAREILHSSTTPQRNISQILSNQMTVTTEHRMREELHRYFNIHLLVESFKTVHLM